MKNITIAQIGAICAEYFGVSIEEIKGTSRKREIVKARQIAMYLAKEHTDETLERIGLEVANKDHSTVIHSINVVNNSISCEDDYLFPHIETLRYLIMKMIEKNRVKPKSCCLPCIAQLNSRPIQSIFPVNRLNNLQLNY